MPRQASGFDATIMIGKETTPGTGASAFKSTGIVESFEVEENNNTDAKVGLGTRNPVIIKRTSKEVDGTIATALQTARLIYAALGKVVDAGDATNGYTHTITTIGKCEELPSFTVQSDVCISSPTKLTTNYIGGKADSLTISASAGEAVELETEWQFLNSVKVTGTAATATAELLDYYTFAEGTVKINNVAVANLSEFEIEVNNNLERTYTINGTNGAAGITEGALEVTSSLNFLLTDTNAYDAFSSGTPVDISITFADPANSKRNMVIDLIGGVYDTNSFSIESDSTVEQEMEAIFKDIKVTCKDSLQTLF